jgi:hypothetical protein
MSASWVEDRNSRTPAYLIVFGSDNQPLDSGNLGDFGSKIVSTISDITLSEHVPEEAAA